MKKGRKQVRSSFLPALFYCSNLLSSEEGGKNKF